MKLATKLIHTAQQPDGLGAVVPPVYQTVPFEHVYDHRGFEYSRSSNPTRQILESVIAESEGGKHSLAFASGVAAITAVLNLLHGGGHLIVSDDIYLGTYGLIEQVFRPWGLEITYVKAEDTESFRTAVKHNTRLILIESPTNPLLKITDIRAVAGITEQRGILLAVDNTFASPAYQNPLALGADIVIHSTTKYISGHSDVLGGAVVVNDDKLYHELKTYQRSAGAVPGPWDCWLALRGIKTLPLRMRAHQENALHLAEKLEQHPLVSRVIYPGLPGHPQHELAKQQMSGFSGIISAELVADISGTKRFINNLKLFPLAASLGGVESLVNHPARMSHSYISAALRAEIGVRDSLVRFSVGIEDKDDLWADVAQALEASWK
ncbi:MAG TPA: PLP-dependent aspartate aminotransferase family protein [Dissulfurispiraceae bacterium]|nr:PLP-dependent aspartate aminotransferase family protein [Dissulfurispiraceae bacterium]